MNVWDPAAGAKTHSASTACEAPALMSRTMWDDDCPPGSAPSTNVWKTALIGLSRSFALEYGPQGVRVNTVLPGLIRTKLADKYDDAQQARITGRTPLNRLGEPEDIGHAVLYLASPAAAFVTGASLVVDGGLSVPLF